MARCASGNDIVRQAKRCSLSPRVGCPVQACEGRVCDTKPTIVNAPTGYSSLAMSLGVLPSRVGRVAPLQYQPVKCCAGGGGGPGQCCGREACCVCPPPASVLGPGGPNPAQVHRFGNTRPGLAEKSPGFVRAGKPVVWTRPAFGQCKDGMAQVPGPRPGVGAWVPPTSPWCGPVLPPGAQTAGEHTQATAWSASVAAVAESALASPTPDNTQCLGKRAGTPLYAAQGNRLVPCCSADNCDVMPSGVGICSKIQAELTRAGVPSAVIDRYSLQPGALPLPPSLRVCPNPCCASLEPPGRG
jgi:hypothetical protein